MLTIRTATSQDASRVVQIYVASWNEGFGELMPPIDVSEDRIARWFLTLAQGNWWLAELDDTIAGFVGTVPSRDPVDPNLGELDTIAVDPQYWRKGVGKALMQKALQDLSSTYPEAILWTLANYPQGQRFYESTGWTPAGTTRANGRQISYRRRF